MTVSAKGLIHITGTHSSGKTGLALTSSNAPTKMIFFDGDNSKAKDLARDLGIKQYFDLTEMGEGLTEIEYHKLILNKLDELPSGMDVIIWDDMSRFFEGGQPYVSKNRSEFKEVWSAAGKFSGPQEHSVTRKVHLASVYSKLLSKATLVIIISHEKPEYDSAGVMTGRMVPDVNRSMETAASITIRLMRNTRNPSDPAPVGLVIKNHMTIDSKTRTITKIFPDRIAPCTWATIDKYLKDPVGNRELTPEEIPDEFEMHTVLGTLSSEQRKAYEVRQQLALRSLNEEVEAAVLGAAEQFGSIANPVLLQAKIMSELSDYNLTNERVQEILDANKEEENES